MPKNILIATLGDHPAVVTGMVKALRELEGIQIDTLHILHPEDPTRHIGAKGFFQIDDHLGELCNVHSEPLPFADANSYEASLQFLRALANILELYDNPDQYHVYLSLAGGRKNMSALMAVTTQFFPAVRGLYHLLDRREGRHDSVFPSIEEMEPWFSEEEIRRAMDPPLEHLNLIRIPYPGAFAQAHQLRKFLKDPTDAPPIPLSPEAEQFFRRIFDPKARGQLLEVWLSKTAYEQYQRWKKQGSHYAGEFLTCFKQMRNPYALKNKARGTFGEFHFYKRRRTRERPFYYTRPNPIHLYPQKPVEQVIICGLSVEQGNGQYDHPAEEWIQRDDRQPYKRLSELYPRERILLVPLGKSPMVVTQTYVLLQESEREGRPRIPIVAVIYPEQSPPIGNAVHMLRRQFKRCKVEFKAFPIKGIADVDSTEACEQYIRSLLSAIYDLRTEHFNLPIALSLSGGRKGMAALTLFAAQRAGIERLYHTLITDVELEERVEEETTLQKLEELPTDEARSQHLFLKAYEREREAFALFSIPVIPLIEEDVMAIK